MNAQVAMRAATLLVGSTFRRAVMLPVVSQPAPEFARPFKTTTVQMGRRAAKIAGRKVRVSLYLPAHVQCTVDWSAAGVTLNWCCLLADARSCSDVYYYCIMSNAKEVNWA
jgi:hypothetical protein